MVMGVREICQALERWEMNAKDVHRRMILAPTPRERERWHAIWLLAQGSTASAAAEAVERDPLPNGGVRLPGHVLVREGYSPGSATSTEKDMDGYGLVS